MFYRTIQAELQKWAKNPSKKPLVIRGARQVGKTTVVNQFAAGFAQYIYLNLEQPEDSALVQWVGAQSRADRPVLELLENILSSPTFTARSTTVEVMR